MFTRKNAHITQSKLETYHDPHQNIKDMFTRSRNKKDIDKKNSKGQNI